MWENYKQGGADHVTASMNPDAGEPDTGLCKACHSLTVKKM